MSVVVHRAAHASASPLRITRANVVHKSPANPQHHHVSLQSLKSHLTVCDVVKVSRAACLRPQRGSLHHPELAGHAAAHSEATAPLLQRRPAAATRLNVRHLSLCVRPSPVRRGVHRAESRHPRQAEATSATSAMREDVACCVALRHESHRGRKT